MVKNVVSYIMRWDQLATSKKYVAEVLFAASTFFLSISSHIRDDVSRPEVVKSVDLLP